MRLFEFSQDSLLADIPTMLAFPNLHDVYEAWREHIAERGADVRLGTEVTQVVERKPGSVKLRSKRLNLPDEDEREDTFDEVIFALDADSALKILGSQATWKEKKILGNVKYFYDISVTHCDREYMAKVSYFACVFPGIDQKSFASQYYELEYREELVADSRKSEESTRKSMEFAKTDFRPLYFIHMYDQDPKKIEMSFDLTHYQPQFKVYLISAFFTSNIY